MERRVESLVQSADQAMISGRLDEAARLWEQVLAASPDHPRALFHLGQHALHRKNFSAARDLLARAAKAMPNDAIIPLNQAFVARTTGNAAEEMEALTRALAIDPYCYPALLSQGALFERQGARRKAARVYKNALATLPPDRQNLPPELTTHIAHAQKLVDDNAREMEDFLTTRLGVTEKSDRMDESKAMLVGSKKAYVQQPAMLHIPRLPAIPYYDNADFPWMKDVEAATETIGEELVHLLEVGGGEFKPYVNHPPGSPLNQWAELNYSSRWSAYYLWKDGKRVEEHCAQCPRTAEVLSKVPMAEVRGFGPTVFFSTLDPHTRIPPHSGDTNARLIVHLPLILPGKCFFRVGNETREWKLGRGWVFDDTIEHEAWNDSDKLRVILIFDVWNPYLTDGERATVGELLNAANEYYTLP